MAMRISRFFLEHLKDDIEIAISLNKRANNEVFAAKKIVGLAPEIQNANHPEWKGRIFSY